MAEARPISAIRSGPRQANQVGIVQLLTFALAFGFAAAIVLGFVH